jgi:hypothetical protein
MWEVDMVYNDDGMAAYLEMKNKISYMTISNTRVLCMANKNTYNLNGHMVPFRVNAGHTSRARFCSDSGGGTLKVEKPEVVKFPAPDRSLLKVITVIDGVEVNDRDAVLRNKLLWIVDCLKTRFPQRKMVGVKKAEKILYAEQYSREDLDRAARLIQKVRS